MKNPCRLLFSSFSLFLSLFTNMPSFSTLSPRNCWHCLKSNLHVQRYCIISNLVCCHTHTHTQTTQPNNSNKFSLNLAPLKNYLAYSREESKCKYCTLDDWCSLTFVNNLNYKLIQWEKPENFSIPNINKFISELNRLLV